MAAALIQGCGAIEGRHTPRAARGARWGLVVLSTTYWGREKGGSIRWGAVSVRHLVIFVIGIACHYCI